MDHTESLSVSSSDDSVAHGGGGSVIAGVLDVGTLPSNLPALPENHFDYPDTFATPLSGCGPIQINEVLCLVFMYLEVNLETMLCVSHVCKAWRERSAVLPQWTPLSSNFLQSVDIDEPLASFHPLSSRELLRLVIHRRREVINDRVLFELRMREVDERNRNKQECEAKILISTFIGYVVILGALLLLVAFYVGYGDNESIGDTLIGLGAFFAVLLVMIVMYSNFPMIVHDNLRVKATLNSKRFIDVYWSLLWFSLVVPLTLCIPVGMVGGRLHSLNALRYAPVLTATCSGPMSTVMDIDKSLGTSAPSYVHIPNTTEWWVQQPFTNTPTSHRTRVYSEITYGLGGCNTSARRWRLFFIIASAYNSTTKTNTTTQYPRRLSDVVNVTGPFDLRTMFSSTYFSNDVGDHYGSTWYDVWMRTRRVYVRLDSASPRTPDEASRQLNDWWWVMYKGIIIVGGVYIFMILWSFLPYGYVLPLMVSLLTFSGIPMIVFGGLCLTDVPYCVLDVGASGTILAFGIVLCMLVCGVISSAVS
eukprot:PhF_6_TR1074/c0_g1_i4/m.2270